MAFRLVDLNTAFSHPETQNMLKHARLCSKSPLQTEDNINVRVGDAAGEFHNPGDIQLYW